ncbi:VENN motif pre-toxin domain-containing protein [Pantoea cypripedii]|uniref:VENN motif-containing domain-containing protein n=1 Tax=Pantoea cypripedii TaxID=55209 RepID=A0A1X1EMT5_PANCY|nr:VENN motif pre-toxin domain-containing protein [Pantoea cypripedii]MBP2198991.1 filamentous hemagglutinin [Pantoea cypripedii]ORM90255.1 hypothetical protein HA50_27385 [Pantoea cypripedii]
MAPYGTGSALQQGIQAATAAVQGLAGGDIASAIAGASAPYLAGIIHDETTTKDANGKEVVNTEANLMAHAVLGAVVASASGNNALAGAAGGVAGEYIAQQLYPGVDRADLSEEQKQTVSALSTLAAGLAGGIAGGSVSSAVTGAQAGKNAVDNNALCNPTTCMNDLFDMSKPMTGGAGMAAAGAGAAAGAAIADALNGDKDGESTPNVGSGLSDEEKAELGGSGSGTPGGWGPEDEEDARNNEAHSATNSKNLNAELTGKEIANGHAYEKHVIQQNEFADLGITTREQFAQHIEDVVRNPTSVKELSGGRSAFWDQSTKTVVIRNLKPGDGGTAFRPVDGRAYFDNLR